MAALTMTAAPPIRAVYETCLYGDDLEALARFYEGVLGLRRVSSSMPRGVALRVNTHSMLLLFNPAETERARRDVPAHGARGPGHVALSIDDGVFEAWKARLAAAGHAVEREITWDQGGRSFYVRDPAGNSIEFIAGEAWPPAEDRTST